LSHGQSYQDGALIVEPEYLEKVRKEIQKYGFFAEIDKNRTDPELQEKIKKKVKNNRISKRLLYEINIADN
jgi:hypothetical protein